MVSAGRVKTLLAAGATALLLVPVTAAPASATDGCTLGSPNIVRDVTECVQSLMSACSLGSPNIITDIKECLR